MSCGTREPKWMPAAPVHGVGLDVSLIESPPPLRFELDHDPMSWLLDPLVYPSRCNPASSERAEWEKFFVGVKACWGVLEERGLFGWPVARLRADGWRIGAMDVAEGTLVG